MSKREEITRKDLIIRAIEAYLTWTPRDRRHEIATQIHNAVLSLIVADDQTVELLKATRETPWSRECLRAAKAQASKMIKGDGKTKWVKVKR